MGTNALITFQRGREGRLRNHRAAEARPAMTHALPLRRIVVGMDGSPASATAVRWAVREARLRHATVHLVCAYHGDARLRAVRLIVLDGALASAPCHGQGGARSRHGSR